MYLNSVSVPITYPSSGPSVSLENVVAVVRHREFDSQRPALPRPNSGICPIPRDETGNVRLANKQPNTGMPTPSVKTGPGAKPTKQNNVKPTSQQQVQPTGEGDFREETNEEYQGRVATLPTFYPLPPLAESLVREGFHEEDPQAELRTTSEYEN